MITDASIESFLDDLADGAPTPGGGSAAAIMGAMAAALVSMVCNVTLGKKGSLHPYALNIEGTTVFTASEEAALAKFALARKQGKKLIDLGCMQVNHHYHGANFNTVSDMVDPLKNITYAAKLLKSLRESEGSWTAAVAKYHCSARKPAEQKRYICSVVANLVATGFGTWTPEARATCGHRAS